MLRLSLTDELRKFVDENSGDGTLYLTPGEFVRDLLRQKKRQSEAESLRTAILEGYRGAQSGRTVAFEGSLRKLLNKSYSGQ